jgi:conjugal transfer pilus assembly protein TraE
MKHLLSEHRLKDLLKQRNMSLVLCAALVGINLLQALALFFKNEHVVIMPPEVKQAFWVERNKASSAYLEEMAVFLSGLALSVSPSSAAFQREVLLRYATPEAYSPLKAQLMQEETKLKKENIATVFRPHSAKIEMTSNRVELTGDLLTYVGDRRVTQARETYEMVFSLNRGQLQLKSFKCLGNKDNG